ncbi:MAG TPA: ATP synthase F0 subunit B [Myxococcota bacterium]|nr:ATP synthase F0 subunit B [Myxococcota bacterium]
MTRVVTRLGSVVAAALAAAPALAADVEGGHGGGLGSHFFWEWANLLLLVAVLTYLARKPALAYLADRRARIESDLASAAKLLADARASLADWNARAARLDEEAADIRRLAREGAELERERILADARAVAARIERDAKSALERELARARKRLKGEVADTAVDLAEQLLREQVQSADRARLVDEFVARIEQGAGSHARRAP